MLLALDVGNTRIDVGLFESDLLKAFWEISNRRDRTEDELGVLLQQLMASGGVEARAISASCIACVVPPVIGTLERMVMSYFGVSPLFVGPQTAGGILGHFDNPDEVGADRIANAVGGFARHGGPLIVVDFGTATTFDAISETGAYLGGAIAPGITISIDALFERAARLPRIELSRPPHAIGQNTVASMQSGIVYGYAGLVEAVVQRFISELGGEPKVVATGGLAPLIIRETGVGLVLDEHLTLEGLRLIHQRHVERSGQVDTK